MTNTFQLDLIRLPVARPLMPMESAMSLLDRSEDGILALIESGQLGWAWDIASHGAKRREVRIWRDSILAYLQTQRPNNTEDQVLSAVLPAGLGDVIKSTQLQRAFSCSQFHVQNLVDQGLLTGLNQAKTGPNGFVRITRSSVVTFLRNRRIT